MYVEILNKTLLIREWLNGSLLPLTINLTFIIGAHLLMCLTEARRYGVPFKSIPGVPTASVLFWIFLAESVRAGSVWINLRAQNAGHSVPVGMSNTLDSILVVCGVVLITSVLRCTYLFTPPKFRGAFWIYSLVVTILFLAASHTFPNHLIF